MSDLRLVLHRYGTVAGESLFEGAVLRNTEFERVLGWPA